MKRLLTRQRLITLLTVLLALILVCLALYFLFEPDIDRALYPREYREYVEKYAKQYDVPENLVYAVIRTESSFDSQAVSRVGAVGLMQMMPSTFRWLTDDILAEQLADEALYNPEVNIRYGTYYLRRMYDRYGDWQTALASYNAGSGRVDGWLEDSSLTDAKGDLIVECIPFEETRNYVKKVVKAYDAYSRLYP
jgi:soluble lytic murein transglycosylase